MASHCREVQGMSEDVHSRREPAAAATACSSRAGSVREVQISLPLVASRCREVHGMFKLQGRQIAGGVSHYVK